MSAAAASRGRSRAGGAGRVTGSTGPGAPYTPGPACSPTPRPSAWRTSSLMIATLRSRPPGASTSVSSRPTAPRDPGLGKYLMQRLIDSLKQAIPDGPEEIQTLDRTLTSRSQDTPSLLRSPPYLQRPHARRSTGAWSTYAASPWDLRNLTNYTIGSLIHTGRLKDHLTTTTSTSR